MKKLYFIPALVLMLAVTSCGDTKNDIPDSPQKPDIENPDNNEPEQPEEPGIGEVVSPTPAFELNTSTVNINPDDTRQIMQGFGASDCWLGNWIGQYWTSNRQKIAELLFSQEIVNNQPKGIGLSMWRVNLGAGTADSPANSGINDNSANNRAEAFLMSTGKYNWNKCQGQQFFMRQAKAMGCEKFIFFSNSPLMQFTKNGQGRSDSGNSANLRADAYGDFADYMAEVAVHFTGLGYNITHISPVNEPQYKWDGDNQEGSGWYNSEVARLVKALDKSLTEKGVSTKILIPEAAKWTDLYSGNVSLSGKVPSAFFNSSSASYVGDLSHVEPAIAVHSYWTFDNWNDMRNTRKKGAEEAAKYNVIPWQTEWSMLDKIPTELGTDYDVVSEYDIAFYMSKVIHNDITVGNCASWSYWTAMSVERWSQKNRFELIKTTPPGGNYSDDFTSDGTVEDTWNLWILGNYSRFVRPGFVRIATNRETTPDFFTTAYLSPDNKTLVMVCTNTNHKKGVDITNDLSAFGKLKEIYTYTTSDTKKMQRRQFNIKDNVFVDPYSVTTVVYNFE